MFAYIGSRTTRERNARGPGISVFDVDLASGRWKPVQVVGDLVNPSFLVVHRETLYAVHGDLSEVSAFRIDRASGRLSALKRVSTGGQNPVHLVIDDSERFLIVANYATGTLALLEIEKGGAVGRLCDVVTLPGPPGPHRIEQTSSHPHHVVRAPGSSVFATPDKGLDRIFFHRLDADNRKLVAGAVPWVQARSGAAPRHIVFSPEGGHAYVVNELDSTITAYRVAEGDRGLEPVQRLSTLPPSFAADNTGAEIDIAPSGRFLFASNRGHDSIVVFDVDAESGELDSPRWTASGGGGPRYFGLDPSGDYLVVANELTDSIVTFAIDPRSGNLERRVAIVETGSPTCIAWFS